MFDWLKRYCSSEETLNDATEVEEIKMIKENILPDGCYSHRSMLKIDGIVIHYISAVNVDRDNKYEMETNRDLFIEFCLPERRGKLLDEGGKKIYASAHYLVGRDGETWHLVPDNMQAWHAGKSKWNDRRNCNGFMLGIEVIGEYGVDFEDEQYVQLASLISELVDKYDMRISRDLETSMVVGHEHVSPDRKKDPGPSFDWEHLWDLLEL